MYNHDVLQVGHLIDTKCNLPQMHMTTVTYQSQSESNYYKHVTNGYSQDSEDICNYN